MMLAQNSQQVLIITTLYFYIFFQWCSQGQSLKAKAKDKASTLKAKVWTFEA